MRSFEVTKTETPKTKPQKPRVKNSLIDSPHPENADPSKLARAFSAKKEKQDLKIEKKNLSLVKKS